MGLFQKLGQAVTRSGARVLSWRKHPRIVAVSAVTAAVFGGLGFILDVASVSSLVFGKQDAQVQSNEAEPPTLRVQYMRTFGALRTGLLATAIERGGFTWGEAPYSKGWRLKDGSLPFEGDFPEFFESFEYKDIAPLKNALWENLIDSSANYDIFYLALFAIEDDMLRTECAYELYIGGHRNAEFEECGQFEAITQSAGFLFAIFENVEDRAIDNIEFVYIHAAVDDNPDFWGTYQTEALTAFCADPNQDTLADLGFESATITRKSLPFAKPDAAFLWPVAAYQWSGEDRFRGRLLDAVHISACMSMDGGPMQPVRAPSRENSSVVSMPYGWYYQ